MSSGEVDGKPAEEAEEAIREKYRGTVHEENGIPRGVVFCLAEIKKQPDDYDGPTRYCTHYCFQREDNPTDPDGFAPRCRLHGGKCLTGDDVEYPEEIFDSSDPYNLKHGMYASDEHLKEDFSDKDQELYDFIMSWADSYGIDREADPAQYDMLQQLAVERVRSARSAKYLLSEGETDDTPVFDNEGRVYEREQTSHALSEEHQRQRKLILKIMKEMGLTPKERSKMDTDQREASAAEDIASLASEALNSGDGSYNPEEYD